VVEEEDQARDLAAGFIKSGNAEPPRFGNLPNYYNCSARIFEFLCLATSIQQWQPRFLEDMCFLQKPFSRSSLIAKVGEAVNKERESTEEKV
jgi:hypothetical protein